MASCSLTSAASAQVAMFRNVQADQLPPEAQLDLKQQPATDEDVLRTTTTRHL